MLLRDVSIFLTIQVAMACLAFAEAYMEGKEGWKWNPKWWRIWLPGGYTYTAYHIFMFFLMLPLLIFGLPLALIGWDRHVFLVLLFSYTVGTRLEDFLWFVVNPDYPFKKWNPRDTRWYPWMTIGKFSIPVSHVVHFIGAAILFSFIYQDWKMTW